MMRPIQRWLVATVAATASGSAVVGPIDAQVVRERTEREWAVKIHKMETMLRPAMREHGIDMWIIMSRENDPDPILRLFGDYGLTGFYGHRNAYIVYDPGGGRPLERTILGTHLSGFHRRFFPDMPSTGHGYGQEGLAPHLREYVRSRDPETIAIDRSRTITMADGLSAEAYEYLVEAIGPEYADRLVSAEPLVIDYVSHRTPGELEIAKEASWITWNILRRAFSNEVITAGETTVMDVYWWIERERHAQDLGFNFPAGISIQRRGEEGGLPEHEDPVIRPGDLLHVDYGIELMGIVTDQQKMIYVLRPGETEPPAGLRELFARSVRMGEIITEELKPGVEGREVKRRAERRGQAEGIENSVYSHAQGNWVHGAGAWAIADWPERYGRHPREPVRPTEFWSVEYAVSGAVPEWDGRTVRMAREEDGWVGRDGAFHWMAGPQVELWVVRSQEGAAAPTDGDAAGADGDSGSAERPS